VKSEYRVLLGKPMGRRHLEDLELDKNNILKEKFKK
jgi:hypothetical protein